MHRSLIILFTFTLIVFAAFSHVQSGEGLSIPTPELIRANDLIGAWRNLDTLYKDIAFVDSTWEVVLLSSDSHPFYFAKDSLGNVSSGGWYPQWPPPSCDLFFKSKDTLEVVYSVMGDTLNKAYYLKIY